MRLYLLSSIIALLFLSFQVKAHNDDDAISIKSSACNLESRVDSLQKKVEELENKQSKWDQYIAVLPHISGYLQTGYNYNSFGNGSSTFQVKRLRLILDGKIKKFQYKIQFEAFSGVNVGSRWEKQKLVQILDAFAQYNFADAVQLRAGQFSSPIGYENYAISPLTNVTIDYAPICSKMVLRNAVGYNYSDYGRDLGIMLLGNLFKSEQNHYYLQYNLAVTNGHLPTVNDNNKSKDIITAFTVWPTKYWNIKAGYNWGEYTPDSFSGNIDNSIYPWQEVIGSKYIPLHRLVIGTWYNNPQGIDIRGEFGHLSSSKNKIKLVDEYCGYLLFAYHYQKWIPVIRGDFYRDNINKNIADNRIRGLIGCSFIANKHIKIQFNYLLSRYTRKSADFSNKGHLYSNEVLLMGLFSF